MVSALVLSCWPQRLEPTKLDIQFAPEHDVVDVIATSLRRCEWRHSIVACWRHTQCWVQVLLLCNRYVWWGVDARNDRPRIAASKKRSWSDQWSVRGGVVGRSPLDLSPLRSLTTRYDWNVMFDKRIASVDIDMKYRPVYRVIAVIFGQDSSDNSRQQANKWI